MKRLDVMVLSILYTGIMFLVALLMAGEIARAAPLLQPTSYCASFPYTCRQGTMTLLMAKGISDNNIYVLEVDPTTGQIPVNASITFSNDTNYGVVGANTLRTAAQLGNATGAADFGQGAVSAQTLRTVSVLSNGTGALATGAGTAGSTVLRVVLPTDQSAIPASQSGSWAVSQTGTWNINNVAGTVTLPTGASTAAKQPALGTAGSASADVITVQGIASMTALKVDGSAVTQPISAVSLPLPSTAATSTLQTSGNSTLSTISGQLPSTLGAKTTANSMAVNIASDQTVPISMAGRAKCLVYRNDNSSVNITTGAYVQVIASTGCVINRLYIFDSSGSALKIATGASLSEIDQLYVPPGGFGAAYELTIPSSTRIAVEALDVNATSGQLIITGLQ